jgi:DNA polymerase-3 subunit epsilon
MSAQLEDIARLLEQSPDFRVLRRLQPRDVFSQSHCEQPLVGIVLDTETTGLDLDKAEVIELAMLKFHYAPNGEVLRVIDRFDKLRQPANPIPPEITELTGITDEMVAGHSIDPTAVEAFVADAAIVIAHNARFDRPIAEKAWPAFKNLDWGCSLDELPWRENGFEGTKLAYLLMGAGLFADAHRAIGDCQALLHILSSPFGAEGKPALATLLANAREATIRIFAVDSPFDRKDLLKGAATAGPTARTAFVVAGGETLPSATSRPNSRSCAPASSCARSICRHSASPRASATRRTRQG